MTRRRWRPRAAFATACAAILLTLPGCAPASRGDFCEIYQPVYTAPADTEDTKSQSDANNAVWQELCGG